MNLYWGDIHNHNEIGYGKGSLERSYAIAKGTLLDFYAFTPHGFWHDQPADDPKMKEFHEIGFQKVLERWNEVKEKAESEYREGKFVTFPAFEWHSSSYGDYHLIHPGTKAQAQSFDSIKEMHAYLKETGAIAVPHHIAYNRDWRGINWDCFDPSLSPVVDIFSEHANGLEFDTHLPMILHSMGGVEKKQTAMEQFKKGLHTGICASTDNHHGHPAAYGEGLTGVWAEKLSRQDIFDAFQKHHVYAVTGDRISLWAGIADFMMGDIIPVTCDKTLNFKTKAVAGIDNLQIIKNGKTVHIIPGPELSEQEAGEYNVRIEFGWGGMQAKDITTWNIKATVSDGEFLKTLPCFTGGDGSHEKINAVESFSEKEINVTSFTSRMNSRPTNSFVVKVKGSLKSSLNLEVQTNGAAESVLEMKASLAELKQRELWERTGNFSSPKIKIGYPYGANELSLEGSWNDPEPTENDFYIVKVSQRNGQTAWSSPMRRR